MLNSTLQIKVKARLNKMDSKDFDNIECWQICEAFNKGQVMWARRQLAGTNPLKQGDEQSKRRIDDLQVLLIETPSLQMVPFPTYDETPVLPGNYFEFKRFEVSATNKCCSDPRPMVVYEVEEANIPILLRDENKKPSFDWAETLFTFINDKARIYTNGEFSVNNAVLMYYRQPVLIQILGCSNPYTGLVSTIDVECEFKDDVTELLIDEAVAILAGDIESNNQLTRETQTAERNN